jgi:hypothetical protein
MQIIKWIIVVLAIVHAGWLAFDGTRALLVGDYVTPQSGPHAGQLGPWSKLVSLLGVDPRSTGMRIFTALYGFAWLAAAIAYAGDARWSWGTLLALSIGGLWYLGPGTVLAVAIVVLLLVRR